MLNSSDNAITVIKLVLSVSLIFSEKPQQRLIFSNSSNGISTIKNILEFKYYEFKQNVNDVVR